MSVFGVDFGCLRSCVAITRNGGVDVVINEVSKRETTTIVSLGAEERLIGESGLDSHVSNMKSTIPCVKHWLGMKVNDPTFESEKRFMFCNTITDEDNRVMFDVNYNNEQTTFYPEQILAMYLQKLQTYVDREVTVDPKYPSNVKDCVLTVPCWYNAEQRRCVQQACEISGLNCMSLLNESTAVAVDYGIFRGATLPTEEKEGNLVAIIDIGYGHTSVNICRFWKGNVRIISRVHEMDVSGREIDYLLFKHFVQEIKQKYKIDIMESQKAQLRVLRAVEKLKLTLSANRSAPLNVENVMDIDIDIRQFSREEYECIIQPLVSRYCDLIRRAFVTAQVSIDDIHSVEMIGGGCRIPIFKQATQEACNGRSPSFTVNATESVARGAAITAAMFSPKFQVREFVAHEVPLLPIMAGHENPGCDKLPSVSFLPGVNDTVCLLGPKDYYPKVLDVNIKRTDEFTLHVYYNGNADTEGIIPNKNYRLGEWRIGNTDLPNCEGNVKIRVRLLPSGLVSCETAYTYQLTEVEVVEEKKDPENPDKEPEKVVVKKNKRTRISLGCTPISILGHKPDVLLRLIKDEATMISRDRLILNTKDARNHLEAYIIDHRTGVAPGGQLNEYILPNDGEMFVKRANDCENWLYEDGSDATLEEYTKRLNEFRNVVEPAKRRHRIHDAAEYHLKRFVESVSAFQQVIDNKKASNFTHITSEEFAQAEGAITKAIEFGEESIKVLMGTPKQLDPIFSYDQLTDKVKEVNKVVMGVVNKPVPKPSSPHKEATLNGEAPFAPAETEHPAEEEAGKSEAEEEMKPAA